MATSLANLGGMTESQHLPLGEVKNRLSEVVERVEREQDRVMITKHGRPAAVLISIDDLESLEETLEVLGDPVLMASIREGLASYEAGEGEILTKDELLARIGRA